LFDLGVRNLFAQVGEVSPKSDLYGQAFEHFIGLELRAYLSYKRIKKKLSYWRTQHGDEVDFIIGNEIAIEVKAATKISDKHLKGLKRLHEEDICRQYYLVSQDTVERKVNNYRIIHWKTFLEKLWQNEIV
jgi:predicted AAA+ superfamily ATPase